MDAKTFAAWAKAAPAGEWTIYHIGYLAADRGMPATRNRHGVIKPATLNPRVEGLAQTVNSLYEQGVVALTQRRIKEDVYEYIATRRPPPRSCKREARHVGPITAFA